MKKIFSSLLLPILILLVSCGEPLYFSELLDGDEILAELDSDAGEDLADQNEQTGSAGDVDYIVDSISNSPVSSESGSQLSQTFTLKNQGSSSGVLDVFWNAYLSLDTELDETDNIVDYGFTGALVAEATVKIDILAQWPEASDVYYIIVEIICGEDTNVWNNRFSSGLFTVNSAVGVVDYALTNLSKKYPNVVAGSYCSETFDFINIGDEDGVEDVTWSAFASEDLILDEGSDFKIADSGSTPLSPLASGIPHSNLSINGNWPGSGGNYYLIVQIKSDDDYASENNTKTAGLFTLVLPPDYLISTVEVSLGEELPGTELSDSGIFEFNIYEDANSAGSQIIGWEVFASLDPALHAGDYKLTGGSQSPLNANTTSPTIAFDNSTWPQMGSYYYVIISINSGDDINLTNNTWVSQQLSIPSIYTEGTEDNSGYNLNLTGFESVSELDDELTGAVLSINELIQINGISDNKNDYDTYKFILAEDVTSIRTRVVWSTGRNDINLKLWVEGNISFELSSASIAKDCEPNIGFYTATGLSPGAEYYLGVYFTPFIVNDTNSPYTLFLQGLE